MKKVLIPLLVFFLMSCTTKTWNKEAAEKYCMQDNKEYIEGGSITKAKAEKICDCVADKMYAKYKSEAELNADKYNQMLVGKECVEAMEAAEVGQ